MVESITNKENEMLFNIFTKIDVNTNEFFGVYLDSDKEVCLFLASSLEEVADRLNIKRQTVSLGKCRARINGTLSRCLTEDMYSESWKSGSYTICKFIEL